MEGIKRAECIRLSDLHSVTFAHDHGDDVRKFLALWLTSPYWLNDKCFERIFENAAEKPCSTSSTSSEFVRRLIPESPLSHSIRHAARETLECIPERLSLADAFLLDQWGGLSTDDLMLFANVIAESGPEDVQLRRIDGLEASLSLPSFLAWCIAETIRGGFPPSINSGVPKLFAEVASGGSVVSKVGINCLLPLPSGIIERSRLLLANHVLVPLEIFPVVATVVPEVSPIMLPVSNDLHSSFTRLVESRSQVNPISALRRQTVLIRRRGQYTHTAVLSRITFRFVIALRPLTNSFRGRALHRWLVSSGFFTQTRIDRRLLFNLDANPWLSNASRRDLALASKVS